MIKPILNKVMEKLGYVPFGSSYIRVNKSKISSALPQILIILIMLSIIAYWNYNYVEECKNAGYTEKQCKLFLKN